MESDWIKVAVVVLAIRASHCRLHRGIDALRDRMTTPETGLRERMARLKGLCEGFTGRKGSATQ